MDNLSKMKQNRTERKIQILVIKDLWGCSKMKI